MIEVLNNYNNKEPDPKGYESKCEYHDYSLTLNVATKAMIPGPCPCFIKIITMAYHKIKYSSSFFIIRSFIGWQLPC